MNGLLTTSLILNITLLLAIRIASNKVKVLRNQLQKALSNENNDELITLAKEKLESMGDVKTVKYLREKKGLTMIAAKQLVDTLKINKQ